MGYLIVISLAALLGAAFMLFRRVREIAPHAEAAGHHAHTNFIIDFFLVAKRRAKAISSDIYIKLRPHAHDLAAIMASKMYKMSSWLAREFLKFYNFIQGRKVLKNSGTASIFIRDLTKRSL